MIAMKLHNLVQIPGIACLIKLFMLALLIAFKARLDKFWKHEAVKCDFTADLTGTGNRPEEDIK